MRLISWNLNARRDTLRLQVASIAERQPDIVALQEVTPTTVAQLRAALADVGMPHAADSFAEAREPFSATGPRRYGLLIASRWQTTPMRTTLFNIPWPERVLTAIVLTPAGEIEVHNTHVPPGSSHGWVKIAHLTGLYEGLAKEAPRLRILCGDFNTPQAELETGEVITWAQRLSRAGGWCVARAIRGRVGIDWDTGERRVLVGLRDWDLIDVFRALHGYSIAESSWVLKRGTALIGRRFDHVFASERLRATHCAYLHDLRSKGLSDHSPIEVQFAWPRAT